MSRKHYKVECTSERRFVAITRTSGVWGKVSGSERKTTRKNSISE